MPIFEKEKKRIYFCHIPKTAGTAVYLAFAESGWVIKNITERAEPHSASSLLKRRYGFNSIEQIGKSFCYPNSLQHVPYLIWKTWGPFDESFAILRHPLDRFLSTVRYRYQHLTDGTPSFEDFTLEIIRDIKMKPWKIFTAYDGHLIPQHFFLGKDTILFSYDENWQDKLKNRYNLSSGSIRKENISERKSDYAINYKIMKTIIRLYRKDFKLHNAAV